MNFFFNYWFVNIIQIERGGACTFHFSQGAICVRDSRILTRNEENEASGSVTWSRHGRGQTFA